MGKIISSAWFVLLPFLMLSCVEDEDYFPVEELVIEGWIEDGGYPVVYVGKSRPPTATDEVNVADYVVRWGKASISDGTKTVVMTGGYTSEPYRPYRYETFHMKGEAGKTYRLQVEYQGKIVSASTTVPSIVAIDSLRAVRNADGTSYCIKAYFRDDRQTEDYYILFSRRRSKDPGFLLSFMGVVSDEVTTGNVEADVYRGTSIQSATEGHSTVYFESGDTVEVRLCHADRTSYLFWKSLSNLQNFSNNMFFPYTTNPESNIEGGKGYWCGYGSDTRTIAIP